ncbi:hypothetical protein AVEN_173203-1 [Araneus ventricosus]|uniref:Uncharacterized protein n=1 Tax=Araneus ventricosus TaxID=182803 RepID=A0A4Y2TEI1_ARAVE|nr:hypothetical protein AVEN_173203-1 [Araneus ventricosus]
MDSSEELSSIEDISDQLGLSLNIIQTSLEENIAADRGIGMKNVRGRTVFNSKINVFTRSMLYYSEKCHTKAIKIKELFKENEYTFLPMCIKDRDGSHVFRIRRFEVQYPIASHTSHRFGSNARLISGLAWKFGGGMKARASSSS